jgi:mannose-6-phosphate isomerase-like protein (cupin superfamily)
VVAVAQIEAQRRATEHHHQIDARSAVVISNELEERALVAGRTQTFSIQRRLMKRDRLLQLPRQLVAKGESDRIERSEVTPPGVNDENALGLDGVWATLPSRESTGPQAKGTNMDDAPRPKHFRPGEGTTYQLGRMSMTFKTTAGKGWNAYTVCEAIEPAGSGAGHHRHPTYDETFVICEGHYDFRLDGNLLKLGPGDVVFVPRGTPHGFVSTGPEVGRQIIISSPGGIFDAMIAELTMLDTGSPTRAASEEARAVATKYGLELLPS